MTKYLHDRRARMVAAWRALTAWVDSLFAPSTMAEVIQDERDDAQRNFDGAMRTIESHEFLAHMARSKLNALQAWEDQQERRRLYTNSLFKVETCFGTDVEDQFVNDTRAFSEVADEWCAKYGNKPMPGRYGMFSFGPRNVGGSRDSTQP